MAADSELELTQSMIGEGSLIDFSSPLFFEFITTMTVNELGRIICIGQCMISMFVKNDWMCKTFPRIWKDYFSKTKFKFNGLGTLEIFRR